MYDVKTDYGWRVARKKGRRSNEGMSGRLGKLKF